MIDHFHDRLTIAENHARRIIAAPTLPIYNISDFPQDAIECQLAIGSDNNLYWYSNAAWHFADASSITVTVNNAPQDVVEGQLAICSDGTGIVWYSNGNWHGVVGEVTTGNPPQDAVDGQFAIGNSDNLCWFYQDNWYHILVADYGLYQLIGSSLFTIATDPQVVFTPADNPATRNVTLSPSVLGAHYDNAHVYLNEYRQSQGSFPYNENAIGDIIYDFTTHTLYKDDGAGVVWTYDGNVTITATFITEGFDAPFSFKNYLLFPEYTFFGAGGPNQQYLDSVGHVAITLTAILNQAPGSADLPIGTRFTMVVKSEEGGGAVNQRYLACRIFEAGTAGSADMSLGIHNDFSVVFSNPSGNIVRATFNPYIH